MSDENNKFLFSKEDVKTLQGTKLNVTPFNRMTTSADYIVWNMKNSNTNGFSWVGGTHRTEFVPAVSTSAFQFSASSIKNDGRSILLTNLFPPSSYVLGTHLMGGPPVSGSPYLHTFSPEPTKRAIMEGGDAGEYFQITLQTNVDTSAVSWVSGVSEYVSTHPKSTIMVSVTNGGTSSPPSGRMSILMSHSDPASSEYVSVGDVTTSTSGVYKYFGTESPGIIMNFDTLSTSLFSQVSGEDWELNLYCTNLVKVGSQANAQDLPTFGYSGINSVYVYPISWDTSTPPCSVSVTVSGSVSEASGITSAVESENFVIYPEVYDFTMKDYCGDSIKHVVRYSPASKLTYSEDVEVYNIGNGDWIVADAIEHVSTFIPGDITDGEEIFLTELRKKITATSGLGWERSKKTLLDIDDHLSEIGVAPGSGNYETYEYRVSSYINASGWNENLSETAEYAYQQLSGASAVKTNSARVGRDFFFATPSGSTFSMSGISAVIDKLEYLDRPKDIYPNLIFKKHTIHLKTRKNESEESGLASWITPASATWNWHAFSSMSAMTVVKEYGDGYIDISPYWKVPLYESNVTQVTTAGGVSIGHESFPVLGKMEWSYPPETSAYHVGYNGDIIGYIHNNTQIVGKDVSRIRITTSNVSPTGVNVSGKMYDSFGEDFHTVSINIRKYFVPDNVEIAISEFDNLPKTRTVKIVATPVWNKLIVGQPNILHDRHYTKWRVIASPNQLVEKIELFDEKGDTYIPGTNTGHELTLKIDTKTFSGNAAQTIGFVVLCELWGDDASGTFKQLGGDDVEFTVDTFPGTDEYSFFYDINGYYPVDSGIPGETPNSIWDNSSTLVGKASLILGGRVYPELSAMIHHGDELIESTSAKSTNYISASCGSPPSSTPYTFSVVGYAKKDNWLSAHSVSGHINYYRYGGNLISATLGIYPTNVYTGSEWVYNQASSHDFVTHGTTAFAEGHCEQFLVKSNKSGDVTNKWFTNVNNRISVVSETTGTSGIIPWREKTDDIGIQVLQQTTSVTGVDSFGMPWYRKRWDAATSAYVDAPYSNIVYTSAPNESVPASSENIRMFGYSAPSGLTIKHTSPAILSGVSAISARMEYETTPPIALTAVANDWNLVDEDWIINKKSHSRMPITFLVRLGNNYSTPGVVEFGAIDDLVIKNTMTYKSSVNINEMYWWGDDVSSGRFYDPDWNTEDGSVVVSDAVSMTAVPEIMFNANSLVVQVGEDVIVNNSTSADMYDHFLVNDGYHDEDIYISDGQTLHTIVDGYPGEGSYTWTVSAFIGSAHFVRTIDNAVNVYLFDHYDSEVERVYGVTELRLPNYEEQTLMPPNEWIVSETINGIFDRLNENYEYLEAMSKFYTKPPLDYVGFLGTYLVGSRVRFGYLPAINDYEQTQEMSLKDDRALLQNCTCAVSDGKTGHVYVVDRGKIYIMDKRMHGGMKHVIDHSEVNENVTHLKNISIDNYGKIYALAPNVNRVVVFDKYDDTVLYPCRFITEWGGYGGASAKHKFRRPNDIIVDKDDCVWVADTGNKAIKKYTNTGSWILTIVLPDYIGETPVDGLISVAVDNSGHVHALISDRVFKYDKHGNYVSVYMIETRDQIPTMIRAMSGAGFLYISFPSFIQKVNSNGGDCGSFGEDVEAPNFTGVWHDEFRNLYVSNTNNVLIFCDGVLLKRVVNDAYIQHKWAMCDIHVSPTEYVQDWVCNISFQRFYDNLELFRRSMLGKAKYEKLDGVSTIELVDFTPEELETLKFIDKQDVSIGVNELVTRDVLNRNFGYLNKCIRVLLEHL